MTSIRKRAPAASSPTVRKVMQANVGRTTAIEARLQMALKARRLKFSVDAPIEPDLRWKADVVFARKKVCVFIDGCFWHGCPVHFRIPRANAVWWTEKIQANIDRDLRQNAKLTERGWRVVRIWEHDLDADFGECVRRLLRTITTGLATPTKSRD